MTPNEFHSEDSRTPLATRDPLAAPARLQGAELQTFLRRKLRRVTTRRRYYGMGLALSMFSGLILTLLLGWRGPNEAAWYCLFVLPFTLYAVLVWVYRITRKTMQAEVKDMAREAGVHAVGTLFEMLYNTEEEGIKDTIRHALTRLLPQMTAADANVLTPYARRTMHGWLNAFSVAVSVKGRLNDLRVASLQALEHIGDSRDIPVVTRLTKMNFRAGENWDVLQAALHCLPILKANCAGVETARTLLRASQAEPAGADTLLRPASGAGQTASAELLRGSDSPDAPPSDGRQ